MTAHSKMKDEKRELETWIEERKTTVRKQTCQWCKKSSKIPEGEENSACRKCKGKQMINSKLYDLWYYGNLKCPTCQKTDFIYNEIKEKVFDLTSEDSSVTIQKVPVCQNPACKNTRMIGTPGLLDVNARQLKLVSENNILKTLVELAQAQKNQKKMLNPLGLMEEGAIQFRTFGVETMEEHKDSARWCNPENKNMIENGKTGKWEPDISDYKTLVAYYLNHRSAINHFKDFAESVEAGMKKAEINVRVKVADIKKGPRSLYKFVIKNSLFDLLRCTFIYDTKEDLQLGVDYIARHYAAKNAGAPQISIVKNGWAKRVQGYVDIKTNLTDEHPENKRLLCYEMQHMTTGMAEAKKVLHEIYGRMRIIPNFEAKLNLGEPTKEEPVARRPRSNTMLAMQEKLMKRLDGEKNSDETIVAIGDNVDHKRRRFSVVGAAAKARRMSIVEMRKYRVNHRKSSTNKRRSSGSGSSMSTSPTPSDMSDTGTDEDRYLAGGDSGER